jgi:hypothetical protein
MIRKASITSKGMTYIKRIDMVSDWLMQIWYRLWKEYKKVILQDYMSPAVERILLLKKIITKPSFTTYNGYVYHVPRNRNLECIHFKYNQIV